MSQLETPQSEEHGHRSGHMGHGLMMIACCIPLLVIAIVLIATGVASASFLFAAIACTVMMGMMMAMMMGGMSRGGK
jgi:hypothetical protein